MFIARKCDAVTNKITFPNMFIDYRVLFCHEESVSASSVQEPYKDPGLRYFYMHKVLRRALWAYYSLKTGHVIKIDE